MASLPSRFCFSFSSDKSDKQDARTSWIGETYEERDMDLGKLPKSVEI